ncbi:hypothetical protein CPB86DRAFT_786677 [Serendipita vermifera]|nr:hypothetical protein CPB86DRAFT_786677 [Serendipita vermifera]
MHTRSYLVLTQYTPLTSNSVPVMMSLISILEPGAMKMDGLMHNGMTLPFLPQGTQGTARVTRGEGRRQWWFAPFRPRLRKMAEWSVAPDHPTPRNRRDWGRDPASIDGIWRYRKGRQLSWKVGVWVLLRGTREWLPAAHRLPAIPGKSHEETGPLYNSSFYSH